MSDILKSLSDLNSCVNSEEGERQIKEILYNLALRWRGYIHTYIEYI